MTTNNSPKSDNLKNALCYIPFVAILLLFIENNKSDELKKHIKYGIVLLVIYSVMSAVLMFFAGLLSIIYAGISIFLGFKAYNGEKFDVEIIDKVEERIKKEL